MSERFAGAFATLRGNAMDRVLNDIGYTLTNGVMNTTVWIVVVIFALLILFRLLFRLGS